MSVIPTVSIGVPVYNAEKHLQAALDSLLAQSFTDFELIVSDNASTDGTGEICKEYAQRDARIRYIRQTSNQGATANFRFVLQQAEAEYFMWAAADDLRSPDFLELNLSFLRQHQDYVASTSPVRFSGGEFNARKMGDAALDADDPNERVIAPFATWHANGRFYSLFRRLPVTQWPHLAALEFLGSDWTLITHLASIGKMHRVANGWVELGTKGMSNTTDIFKLYRKRWIHWVLPFHTVTTSVFAQLRNPSLRQRFLLLARLLRLNRKAARQQLRAWRKSKRT